MFPPFIVEPIAAFYLPSVMERPKKSPNQSKEKIAIIVSGCVSLQNGYGYFVIL